ncbi:hypothetical protein [Cellulosilyticum sp. I15G10I2]|uniref:hypothetical protein n=1 Tax=Cellulosilyticum sp. I15G10I2 TaxID=1892843 RepID=UPI00085BCFBF|nr:hypothetical protein [Cellulosilyticum sp. I15G10I2]
MHLNTRDTVLKKMLDAQENVRDYESFSKRLDESNDSYAVEVKNMFKEFAEESGFQAQKLKEVLEKYDSR